MSQRDLARATRSVARPSRRTLGYATAVLTGAMAMSLEIAAVRLFAPHFGQSVYVWGNVIAIVMGALAVGYALGGRLADRSPSEGVLYRFLLAAGIYQVGSLYAAQAVLTRLGGLGDVTGPGLAAALLIVPPLIIHAAATPFLIRLHADASHVGRSAGLFSALGTLGGIGGVLGTTFLLIPYFGTNLTLVANSAACLGLACAGLGSYWLWPAAVATVGVLLLLIPPLPITIPNALFIKESPYNLVAVIRAGRLRALVLNEPRGIHTLTDDQQEWTGAYFDDFASGPLVVPTRSALLLGLGGGESLRALYRSAPDAEVTAVEIDPEVVDAARRFFDVRHRPPQLAIHVDDARAFLKRDRTQYDLVQCDLFQGGPYVPFYLTTREFFALVRARMSDDALLMINVLDRDAERELLRTVVATVHAEFPSVWIYSRPEGNHFVFAFTQVRSHEELLRRLNTGVSDDVKSVAARVAAGLVRAEPDADDQPWTDDYAPVERFTRRMLRETE